MEERAVKRRILAAATELIQEEQDFEKISMRSVARRAGVAVSMVNYHYQTKANLINLAVQSFVSSVIRSAGASVEASGSSGMSGVVDGVVPNTPVAAETPTERMRRHLLGAATFIARNPGISRVSILRDLSNPSTDDNTSQVVAAAQKQLAGIIGQEITEPLHRIMAEIQAAAMQHLFLRAAVIKEQIGLDYYDEKDRHRLIDLVVETITGEWKG